MSLRHRSPFWVVLFFVFLLLAVAGSQLWLQFAATPNVGVAVTIQSSQLSGPPAATRESFVQDSRIGVWMEYLEIPGSLVHFTEKPRPVPFSLAQRFDLRAWLEGGFPDATIERLADPAPFAAAADDADCGVEGSVTEVRLRHADGAIDPIWFVRFTIGGEEARNAPLPGTEWGLVVRFREGEYIRPLDWTVSARDGLRWRENLRLRKEIGFLVEIWVSLAEREEGEVYWLDAVGPNDATLPQGALPVPPPSNDPPG